MWSTELIANGFNQVPAETSLDDLDDIEFNFRSVQGQEKSTKLLQTVREKNGAHTLDALGQIKKDITRDDKLTLHQSLSLPTGMRKSETSTIYGNTKSTTTRTVEITRTSKDPLGFFIRQGDGLTKKTGIFISRVTKGSLADSGNLLKVGDEILEINKVDIKGYCLIDVVELIQAQTHLNLTLRKPNRTQGYVRPGIYTRHSSPSLLKKNDKDQQKAIHSRDDSQQLMTSTPKHKQKDKSNANDFDSSELSKNTSTIDELIRLLRAHTEEQNRQHKDEAKTHSPDRHLDNNTPKNEPTNNGNPNFLAGQTNAYHEARKISTITPTTTVDLLFDDDDTEPVITSQQSPNKSEHPYHRISITKSPEKSSFEQSLSLAKEPAKLNVGHRPRSRSSSYGSGSEGSSPRPRRRLPSLPTEEINRKRSDSTLSVRENKPRRILPSPPASPVMEQRHLGLKLGRAPDRRQKTLSWGGPGSGSLTQIRELVDAKRKDTNNNKPTKEKSLRKQQSQSQDHVASPRKHQDHSTHGPVVYRRSQSQYSDVYEQQRHSMFLQTVSSGKTSLGSSRSSASLSLSFEMDSDTESIKDSNSDLKYLHVSSGSATLKVKSREASPLMRRRGSSSFLFGKSRDKSPASHCKVESDPGFKLFPDEYKDIDLTCTRAVSGMMKVRIIKAVNLNSIDKKKSKKIFCAVEVDFERKACTFQKKVSRNPTWDEVFDVEIQHGREMTFLCYGSKKEFEKPIARASFFLTPLVRQSQAHQLVIRLEPEGLLYMELEFTEIKTLLKRTPSSKNSGIFGFNLSVTSQQEQCDVPLVVRKCVSEIEKRGLDTVGLYRISGNARKKENLKTQFEENSQDADISADNCPDINVVTGILKDYLRELPEPLITEKMSQQLLHGIDERVQDRETIVKKRFLSRLVSELPESNKNTLAFILSHLCRVVSNPDNKMDSRNLSVCLAPVLQYSPTHLTQPKDLLGLRTFLKAVEVLIEMWNEVEAMDKADMDSSLEIV